MYFGDGGYYCAVTKVMLRYRDYYLQHFVVVPSMIGLTYKFSLLNSAMLRSICIATMIRKACIIIIAQINIKMNRDKIYFAKERINCMSYHMLRLNKKCHLIFFVYCRSCRTICVLLSIIFSFTIYIGCISSLLFYIILLLLHSITVLPSIIFLIEETSISTRSKRLMQFMNDFLVAKKTLKRFAVFLARLSLLREE